MDRNYVIIALTLITLAAAYYFFVYNKPKMLRKIRSRVRAASVEEAAPEVAAPVGEASSGAAQVITPTFYSGNNGTVTGDTYCEGAWGSVNGANKNMKCVKQSDTATGELLECGKLYATASGLRGTNVYCI